PLPRHEARPRWLCYARVTSGGTFMDSSTPPQGRGLLLGVACVGILLLGGYFAYPYVHDYMEARPDTGDYQADAGRLHKLRQAALAPRSGPPATAEDGPQWRGPNRDGVAPAKGLLASWPPAGPRVVWKAGTGAGYSSPAVAGGRVFLLVQQGD